MYSEYSIKRDYIQLYCSLNDCGEQITKFIQMKDYNAYCNYTTAYDDSASEDLLRYFSVGNYIQHAEQLKMSLKSHTT